MTHLFQTKSLVVRQFCQSDLDSLYQLCQNPNVMKWVGDGQIISREQCQIWIDKQNKASDRPVLGTFAVLIKESDEFVGYAGIVKDPALYSNEENKQAPEIIYALKQEIWGQGYARELVPALIEYAFVSGQFESLLATIDPANAASLRLVKNSGMLLEHTGFDEFMLPIEVYRLSSKSYFNTIGFRQKNRKHK